MRSQRRRCRSRHLYAPRLRGGLAVCRLEGPRLRPRPQCRLLRTGAREPVLPLEPNPVQRTARRESTPGLLETNRAPDDPGTPLELTHLVRAPRGVLISASSGSAHRGVRARALEFSPGPPTLERPGRQTRATRRVSRLAPRRDKFGLPGPVKFWPHCPGAPLDLAKTRREGRFSLVLPGASV